MARGAVVAAFALVATTVVAPQGAALPVADSERSSNRSYGHLRRRRGGSSRVRATATAKRQTTSATTRTCLIGTPFSPPFPHSSIPSTITTTTPLEANEPRRGLWRNRTRKTRLPPRAGSLPNSNIGDRSSSGSSSSKSYGNYECLARRRGQDDTAALRQRVLDEVEPPAGLKASLLSGWEQAGARREIDSSRGGGDHDHDHDVLRPLPFFRNGVDRGITSNSMISRVRVDNLAMVDSAQFEVGSVKLGTSTTCTSV